MSQKVLLEEIIQQLVDPEQSLEGPLLRLKVFALKTKNKELEKFVNNEINGYEYLNQCPDYRLINGLVQVDIQMGFQIHRDQIVESFYFETSTRSFFERFTFYEGVSLINELIIKCKNPSHSNSIYRTVPVHLLQYVNKAARKKFKDGTGRLETNPVNPKILIQVTDLISCISNLRSKLIDFCIEAANEFNFEIDITSFNNNQNSNNQKINHIMNQTIINTSGDGNLINTGKNNQITSSVNITKGDLEGLKNKLKELGIDSADIVEFEEIINTEQLDVTSKNLSHTVIDWITNIYSKSLKGIGNISKGVTIDLLVELIKQYLGAN